jgi:hypothetical protein
MCGRYASFLPAEVIDRLFRTVNPLPNAAANWNIAPKQDALGRLTRFAPRADLH